MKFSDVAGIAKLLIFPFKLFANENFDHSLCFRGYVTVVRDHDSHIQRRIDLEVLELIGFEQATLPPGGRVPINHSHYPLRFKHR
ncbi:hypothetical protein D3C77_628060 [compost metagenome]